MVVVLAWSVGIQLHHFSFGWAHEEPSGHQHELDRAYCSNDQYELVNMYPHATQGALSDNLENAIVLCHQAGEEQHHARREQHRHDTARCAGGVTPPKNHRGITAGFV